MAQLIKAEEAIAHNEKSKREIEASLQDLERKRKE
jgi:hypothetical protein